MTHFSATEWIEFGRGMLEAGIRQDMKAHLSLCNECRQAAELWSTVATLAGRDHAYAPPVAEVRKAKALASFFSPQLYRPASVIADTRYAVAPGLRHAAAASRQIAVEAGQYAIDVQIEFLEVPEQVRVTGQVMERKDPYGVAYLPVLVKRSEETQLQACTNRFGEFQFDLPHAGKGERKLLINLPDGTWTEIELKLEQ